MPKTYYKLLYRLDGAEGLLLWFSNNLDGVCTAGESSVPSFNTEDDLLLFASNNNISVSTEEPVIHNLDAVQAWINDSKSETLNCGETLAAWNLFVDVASSVPVEAGDFEDADRKLNSVYEKIFWGSNLPAVTPVGERFEPDWTAEELASLVDFLAKGLGLFRGVLKHAV